MAKKIEAPNAQLEAAYQEELRGWTAAREAWIEQFAASLDEFERAREGELDAMEALIAARIGELDWPCETILSYEWRTLVGPSSLTWIRPRSRQCRPR